MKVNTKIRYGLRTMIELAKNNEKSGLFQKEIAENQDIPLKYLDKIISGLKASGLITNVGGKKSGYMLTRSPSKISVYDIFRTFEGKLSIIECVNGDKKCCSGRRCASHEFWSFLNTEMEATLISRSLESLVKRQIELDDMKNHVINFQI